MRAILFAVAMLTTSMAQAVPDIDPDFYAGGRTAIGDRVINLPEDGHAYHTVVAVSAQPSAREQQIIAWFNSDRQLAKLKAQTHFHLVDPSSPYWSRYVNGMVDGDGKPRPPLFSELPAVTVQRPDGVPVARFQGNSSHLDSASNLSRAIASCIHEAGATVGRFRPCPGPDCRPKPEPQPQPYQPDPGPFGPKPHVPDIEPPQEVLQEEIKAEETGPAIIAAIIIVGLFLVAREVAYFAQRNRQVT